MSEETKTLRDEFAMAALTGLCVFLDTHRTSLRDSAPRSELIGKLAYDYADACLAARTATEN